MPAPPVPRSSADPRAWRLTLTVAAVSMALLAVALVAGWLGPDVGRGAAFCEAARDAVVRQPANTLSNLGFVVAGLAIAHHVARRGTGGMSVRLATAYGILVVLLGPGSAAMHATQSALGGRMDTYSMYLLASFVFAYAGSRALRWPTGGFVVLFAGALIVCTVAEFSGVEVPLLMTAGNLAFAVLLLAGLVMELWLRRSGNEGLDLGWGLASLATLLVALVTWSLGKDGGPLCDPGSLLQPHAVWHLLDAVAAWFLFRYYVSGRPLPPRTALD